VLDGCLQDAARQRYKNTLNVLRDSGQKLLMGGQKKDSS
jgi:hypothetical protein